MRTRLPWSAKDIFRLSVIDRLLYSSTITFARCTGLWRYPIPCSGDLETMRLRDKIYWLYKAQFPIARASKGAGLERYFENQAAFHWALPEGFRPTTELRLSAVGDLMDHPYLPNSAEMLYESVADKIFGADISMANLECVLSPSTSESFVMSPSEGPPLYYGWDHFKAAKGFRGRNYSFMATACNHSLDCGEGGVRSTIDTLRAEGIAFNGVNETAEAADAATIVPKNGFTIGLVSHTFGLNAKKPPKDKPWIVNRTNLNGALGEVDFGQFRRQIQFCRDSNVDAIIAMLHWGMEHGTYPRPQQLDVAHYLAEIGVDVVIGHHPHVIQPMEYYRTTRDPDRIVPVYYSLGNLLTPFSHPAFRVSAVARIMLATGVDRNGSKQTYVSHADMRRVFQEIDEPNKTLRLVPFSSTTAQRLEA